MKKEFKSIVESRDIDQLLTLNVDELSKEEYQFLKDVDPSEYVKMIIINHFQYQTLKDIVKFGIEWYIKNRPSADYSDKEDFDHCKKILSDISLKLHFVKEASEDNNMILGLTKQEVFQLRCVCETMITSIRGKIEKSSRLNAYMYTVFKDIVLDIKNTLEIVYEELDCKETEMFVSMYNI